MEFSDLEANTKQFYEEIINVKNEFAEWKSKLLSNNDGQNKIEKSMMNAGLQKAKQMSLLEDKPNKIKQLEKLNMKIKSFETSSRKKKNDDSYNEIIDYEGFKKALKKSAKKYFSSYNIEINIEDTDNIDVFVASVTFLCKDDPKTVNFLIHRQQRTVLDFDTKYLLSENEEQIIRENANTSHGLDTDLVLQKLRNINVL